MATTAQNATTKIVVDDPAYDSNGKYSPPNHAYDITIKRITTPDVGKGAPEVEIVKTITVYPHLYLQILSAYAIISISIFFVAFLFGDVRESFGWGGAVIGLQGLHLGLSIASIKGNERGGLLFWGKPIHEVSSGLVFVPIGIIQLYKLPRSPIQIQFPGNPEEIYKNHDKEYFTLSKEEQERYVLPIRATTGAPSKDDTAGEAGILNTQMTLEITFYIRWTIEEFWVFFVRIGTVGEAIRQFRDSGERVIIQEIAKRTPAKVIAELSMINDALTKKFEEITQDSGVHIDETSMLSPDINHSVNVELRNVVTAKAKAVQTIVSAEAMKVEIEKRGEGEAAAKLADFMAQAEGAKAMGLEGRDIIDLEKTKAIAKGDATIILDGGQNATNLVGLGTRLGIGMNQSQQRKPEQA